MLSISLKLRWGWLQYKITDSQDFHKSSRFICNFLSQAGNAGWLLSKLFYTLPGMSRAELYLMKTDDTTDLLSLLPFPLPEHMLTKALRYLHLRDRNNYLAGRWMLYEYFRARSIPFDFKDIHYTEKGKPVADNDYQFNISHTNGMAGVLVSKVPVGLDIEEIKKIDDVDEFAAVFTGEEIARIKEHGTESFFAHWTLKEAVMKWCGEGITNPAMLNATKMTDPDTAVLYGQHFHVQSFIIDNAFYLTQAYLKSAGLGSISEYNYGTIRHNRLALKKTPIDHSVYLDAVSGKAISKF